MINVSFRFNIGDEVQVKATGTMGVVGRQRAEVIVTKEGTEVKEYYTVFRPEDTEFKGYSLQYKGDTLCIPFELKHPDLVYSAIIDANLLDGRMDLAKQFEDERKEENEA